jgi:hypothetical protein
MRAFAYEIRRQLCSYEEFEGLARMEKAPRHLGKRSAGAVLALHERCNGEVVDAKKWFKYTGRNRAELLKKGCQLVAGDWTKAVKQAAKEQRAQGT